MKYEEDDRYGIPIGLPPEIMPEQPNGRTWQQEVEGFFHASRSQRKPRR